MNIRSRNFVLAAALLASLALPACTRRSAVVPQPGVTTPPPPLPVASQSCLITRPGPRSASLAHHALSATPSPLPVTPAQFSFDSNPQGLTVQVDGATVGTTPTNQTPPYANPLHSVTIVNAAGGPNYQVYCAQDGNPVSVYYNRLADTTGRVLSVTTRSQSTSPLQSSAVARTSVRRAVRGRARATASKYVPGVIEVQYRRDALAREGNDPASIESAEGVRSAHTISLAGAPFVVRTLRVDPSQRDAVLARLRSRPDVATAEPAQYRYLKTTTPIAPPNDPHFSPIEQWDMYRIGMLNAWAYSPPGFGSSSVKLAVLDTGLDVSSSNTMVQADLVSHVVHAERVVNGSVTQGIAAVQDDDGHGTNVTGIAAAVANNGTGFAGVAGATSLQIYKIFSGPNATTADEAQAIYDALANGARVINLSLGSCPGDSGAADSTEKTAIEFAIQSNTVVVAAAGNERASSSECSNTSLPPAQNLDFPAAYPGVLAVGASALSDNGSGNPSGATEYVASYSNSGPNLAVVAPGGDPSSNGDPDLLHWISNLYSTTGAPPCSNPANCYVLIAGTSQATPHVSGAVALMLAANPGLTPAQVIADIESTADDISDPNQGHGRLDVYRAMALETGDTSPPAYTPGTRQLVAFAYANSGATDSAPQILNVTFPQGVPVNADGTFRVADIPTSATSYKIGVWYDANGDGLVDAGDRFGASGTCTATQPCTSATSITVTQVTGTGFPLP